MMFKPDDHHMRRAPANHVAQTNENSFKNRYDAPKEFGGLVMLCQAGDTLENTDLRTDDNNLRAESSSKVRSRAEKEEQPSYAKRQKLNFISKTKTDKPTQTGPATPLATSSSSLPSDTSSCSVKTSRSNVLSQEAFESSIERSFKVLNDIDLSRKISGEKLSDPFFSGSEKEWDEKEVEKLVAFANKNIIGVSERHEHDGVCAKTGRRI